MKLWEKSGCQGYGLCTCLGLGEHRGGVSSFSGVLLVLEEESDVILRLAAPQMLGSHSSTLYSDYVLSVWVHSPR